MLGLNVCGVNQFLYIENMLSNIGPEVINPFSCTTLLNMKFILRMNVINFTGGKPRNYHEIVLT